LVLGERLRLGVNLPIRLFSNGDSVRINGTRYDAVNSTKVGDLRLGADLRLLGEYDEAFTLAIGARLHLPSGNQKAYTGDGKVRIEPRLMAAGDVGPFAYAARVGFLYRALHGEVTGNPFGNEFTFAASAGARLVDKKLVIGPELFGSTVVQKKNSAFKKDTTPVEIIIGAKYRFGDYIAGLGVGPGLTRGYGSPAVRILASFDWFPEFEKQEPVEKPKDTDNDGIIDSRDACPNDPGVPSDDPELNGCPPPADRDGDGIADNQDACPDQAGVKSDDPKKNGCPLPVDRDGDGVPDDQDACPDQQGIKSDDPVKNGCPAPVDSDNDGIVDDQDACPNEPGVKNDDPKKNGCPVVVLTKEQIVVNERIEFETNEATLRASAETILASVLKILQEHTEITKLSVEGHTDNRGGKNSNLDLSRRRAAAVANWLIGHGIDKSRLTSTGFGKDRPIDDNNTEQGRQNNRRVEFKIVK
jgi:outer membrane protein OmpA-like peptidoglycan-associated protein